MAIAHTVSVEQDENLRVLYRSWSPDEVAIVKAAANFGYFL